MEQRVFPLSREFYEDFTFYYPFGNSPAEDFLSSVSVADSREPTVLSLGCGDMRSPMFTILNNLGFEGDISDGFSGAHFVMNDRLSSILARNILFLYLCMFMPDSAVARKRWIASTWSLWYNHELLPEHNEMLVSALQELCQWSSTWHEWSKCPLGKIVKFSSPASFAAVKIAWKKWQSFSIAKSIKEMQVERECFQLYHMQSVVAKSRMDGLVDCAKANALQFQSNGFVHSPSTETIEKEFLEYLLKGNVWGEEVLGIPIGDPIPKTVVNPTMFARDDGSYTLHYSLTPYNGYNFTFQFTNTEVSRTQSAFLKFLPVRDAFFQSTPLLANCVQQFSMWLQATANMISNKTNVSFTFVLEDAINLCYTLLHYPENYPELNCMYFDAIYTSNLFDHISPPALLVNAMPLLKSNGTLFTVTFSGATINTLSKYLEQNFGFSPEYFPALLRVHCLGQDGPYSPAVNHYPHLSYTPQLKHTLKAWRNVTSCPQVLDSIKQSPSAMKSLLNLCKVSTSFSGINVIGSVESFICILHQFLKNVRYATLDYQFLEPLSTAIKSDSCYKPHLIQLQTQLMLHGIHMHLIVTEDNCPTCTGQPLNSYLQQYTISLDIESCNMMPYSPPTFDIHFSSLSGEHAILKSFSLSSSGSKLTLTFFFPKLSLPHYCSVSIEMWPTLSTKVFQGQVEDIKPSTTPHYVFMKQPVRSASAVEGIVYPLGHVVKHIGDSDKFETVISMSDACQTAMKTSKMATECLESHQLKICCGELEPTIITYPYAIDESKTLIKISSKKREICIAIQRKCNLLLNGKPAYFTDSRSKIALPKFQCAPEVMEKYYYQQSLYYDGLNHPLYNAKRSLIELFKHALNGHKVFTFSFPSKRFIGSPDVYALVYVHGLRFDTVFGSPLLDVSYCFLDTMPPHTLPEIHSLHNQLCPSQDIMVDDAEYKILKEIFKYFSSTLRHPFPGHLNSITKKIVQHKLWERFDHAVLFPLYPNPANPTYQKFVKFTAASTRADQSVSSLELAQMMGQGSTTECSYCHVSATSVNCEQCQRASYCSRECLQMHLTFHKGFCNNDAKQKEMELSISQSAEVLPQNPPINSHPSSLSSSSSQSGSARDTSTTDTTAQCDRCKKPGTILCKCGQVYYCSQACQTLELPLHKEKCQQSSHDTASGNSPPHSTIKTETLPSEKPPCACDRCKKPAVIICQCQQVSYCSKECQKLEWPGHSDVCKKPTSTPPTKLSPADQGKARLAEDAGSKKAPYTPPKCSNCNKDKSSLKRCACKNASYCSVECQRLHWPQHKSTCTATKK